MLAERPWKQLKDEFLYACINYISHSVVSLHNTITHGVVKYIGGISN